MVVELWNNLRDGTPPGSPRRPLLRDHGHRPGARPRRDRPGGRRRGADRLRRRAARPVRAARAAWHGGPPRGRAGPVLAGAAGVAAYQASFFAAVDDTGRRRRHDRRARLRARAHRRARVGAARPPAARALGRRDRAGERRRGAARARGRRRGRDLAARRRPRGPRRRLLRDVHARLQAAARRRPRARGRDGGAVRPRRGRRSRPCWSLSGPGWLATGGGLALVLFLGVVPTAIAYVLFARGLRGLRGLRGGDDHARGAGDGGRAGRLRARRAR